MNSVIPKEIIRKEGRKEEAHEAHASAEKLSLRLQLYQRTKEQEQEVVGEITQPKGLSRASEC